MATTLGPAPRSPLRPSEATFVLFKQSVITAHDSHFAGGKHAFLSIATTLAAAGFHVHLVSIANRGKVLVHAGLAGLLQHLSFAKPGVVTWREKKVNHHVLLEGDAFGGMPYGSASWGAAVSQYVRDLVHSSDCASVFAKHQDHIGNSDAFTAQACSQTAQSVAGSEDEGYYSSRTSGRHEMPEGGVLASSRRQEGIAGSCIDNWNQCGGNLYGPCGSIGGSGGAIRGGEGILDAYRVDADGRRDDWSAAQGTWVIVDADESQKILRSPEGLQRSRSQPQPAAAAAPNATTTTLFESIVVASPPQRCLAYVQNVHFLPMGPSGTGPRHGSLLAAWDSLGAVLAVSEFVAGYIRQYWPCHRTAIPGATTDKPPSLPALPPPVRLVPLATWRVFGEPPFPDLAAMALPRLQAWRAVDHPPTCSGPTLRPLTQGSSFIPEPVDVAVLKCTPEKGASIVVELAKRLAGRVRFRVVSGDPAAAVALAPLTRPFFKVGPCIKAGIDNRGDSSEDSVRGTDSEAGGGGGGGGGDSVGGGAAAAPAIPVPALAQAISPRAPTKEAAVGADPTAAGTAAAPSAEAAESESAPAVPPVAAAVSSTGAYVPMEIWEPQPDVSRVLAGCVAVLAPSLWLEAWGMVVTEALLRGLPVIVSNLGGLPEAGMGVCPAVPVEPILIPQDRDGMPDWDARKYPKQDIDVWEHALLSLLRLGSADEADKESGNGVHDGGVGDGDDVSDNTIRAWARSADRKGGDHSSECVTVGGNSNCGDNEVGNTNSDAAVHQPVKPGGSGAWERLSREGRNLALEHVQRADTFLSEWLTWLARLG
ncbi:hypothetical protein VaNZ11_005397 [Volvox africanus]|uniref:Glycosyl transferase family 1 domain-containing protein n=1 Tax=Volvox africanus TaxID=51714 RepID=A0ABQ5RZC7_9CHLO|nr:hypothetical protein VaNZ11_005397 [Volvox africanus]